MEWNSSKLSEAEARLSSLLGPELSQITDIVSSGPNNSNPYYIELPVAYAADLPLEELSSLVARSSNVYGKAARFAGMARAEAKLARGRFERKYKRSKVGRNDSEREQNAMTTAADEHLAWTLAEAVAELADSLEASARVASESVRKIYTSAENQQRAANREAKGTLREEDFISRPY